MVMARLDEVVDVVVLALWEHLDAPAEVAGGAVMRQCGEVGLEVVDRRGGPAMHEISTPVVTQADGGDQADGQRGDQHHVKAVRLGDRRATQGLDVGLVSGQLLGCESELIRRRPLWGVDRGKRRLQRGLSPGHPRRVLA
jgi:hypothetical protein